MTAPDEIRSSAAGTATDPTRRNVLILALCVALGMSGNGIVLAAGALAAAVMLVDDGWATLPLAVMFTATMLTTIPASILMGRIGRRAGFSIGAVIGFTVAYGISDNDERFFSNEKVAHLGYRPKDSAEAYRAEVEAEVPVGDPFDPAVEFVGGSFCQMGHPDDD